MWWFPHKADGLSADIAFVDALRIAERRREASGWRPCGVGVATLIEKARAAAAHARDVSGRVAYPRPTA
jgi:hypothetical protein